MSVERGSKQKVSFQKCSAFFFIMYIYNIITKNMLNDKDHDGDRNRDCACLRYHFRRSLVHVAT